MRTFIAAAPSPPAPPPAAPGPGWLPRLLADPGLLTRYAAAHTVELAVSAAAVTLTVLTGVWIRGRVRARWHARLCADARTVEIQLPPEVGPEAAAVFWAQMSGLLRPPLQRLLHGQPHLGWEWLFDETGSRVRVWVPGVVPPGMVEHAVSAAWPGARVTTRPADDPLPAGVRATGGQLRLARPDVLPLRAEWKNADPVRALLTAAADLDAAEHVVVQVLARPVTGRRLAAARRAAAAHRGQRTPSLLSRVLDGLTPHPGSARPAGVAAGRGPTPPEESAESRAIGGKAVGPRWEAALRYAVASTLPVPARTARRRSDAGLRGRAHAVASAYSLYAGHNYLHRGKLAQPAAVLAARRLGRGDLLGVAELAALAHLPVDTAVPGLARAGAAAVAPPAGIPRPGPAVKSIGDADAGRARPVGLAVPDARHHVHILGATGSGKSTLLANMILDDAQAGRGLAVIDPKGDLVNDLLARLPAGTADRVVLIDPDDAAAPPCLNILDGDDPDLATDQLVGIVRRIWADSWGPRSEDLLRAACLTLLDTPGSTSVTAGAPTLRDIVTLLTDGVYRQRVTAGMTDPILAGFWSWYGALSDAGRAQIIGPIMNKLRALLLRKFATKVLAAGPSTVDLTGILDRGGILLVRVPKGAVGEDACQIIGSIVLAKIWQAVLQRAARLPQQRPDASTYLDECQNFLNVTGSIEDLLAEARGYRLSLILAHQNLAQLPRDLADALATNARSKILFTCSPGDARALARHTAPVLSEHDLARLPAFTAAARLVVASADSAAFTIRTRPLPPAVPGRAAQIRRAARRHTGPGTGPGVDPRNTAVLRGGHP